MERTIAYDGGLWTVWINPAPSRDGPESGLELVFTSREGRRLRHPVGLALLRALSRDGLEVDEAPLVAALAAALMAETNGNERPRGGADARA